MMVQYCKKCGKPRAQSRGQLCVVCELERLESKNICGHSAAPVESLTRLQGLDR